MSMKGNWMAAFGQTAPNPLYGKPLTYNPTGEFGTAFGPLRVGRVDSLGDTTQEFARAVSLGFNYVVLVNADMTSLGALQSLVTKAHGYGLGIVALNPTLTQGQLAYVSHNNTMAIISTVSTVRPIDLDILRDGAWKKNVIPVWLVLDDKATAQAAADQIKVGQYKGMGVLCKGETMALPEV